jgi:transposase-like protein
MDTHLPLRLWFEVVWQVTSQKYGASALGLQRVLGLGSYRTAWTLLHKLRRAMVLPGRERLKGLVEVDEIYIGGERKRRRRFENKAVVLVAAEEESPGKIGRIRLLRIEDRSASELRKAIEQLIEPGSGIRTDDWQGYSHLEQLGYRHERVHYTSWGSKNILPLANRVASLVKRWLLGTHQGSTEEAHLDYYLDEFTFRFNRRTSNSRGLLFYRLLSQAMAMEARPNKTLKGGRNNPHHKVLGALESSA